MRKDKQKVVDEVWDDARIDSFLAPLPGGFADPEYQLLLRAYRGMRASDFERFLARFVASGGNPDAASETGTTLREELESHRHAGAYRDALDRVRTSI